MLNPYTDIKAIPFRGGCVTSTHKALLPFGGMSAKQNLRDDHPGLRKRLGQKVLHTTADGTNGAVSLYPFRKRAIDESHFFAQMSDGDVLEATNAPPVVTTGVLGSEVFSGTGTGEIPASWGNLNDILIYSNGVDQHKLYAGTANYVSAFIIYDSTEKPANIPEVGTDYTTEVTDGLTTTSAILDSFGPTALPANVTAITKANPGVVSSVGHSLAIGDIVYFSGLTQMTELNGTLQTVSAVGSVNLFSINNTSGYGAAETTGGACGWNANACLFICTPIPANRLTWTMAAANGTASVGTLYYRKNDNTWADTSETDGTILSARTLGQIGSMTWTYPTDEIPCFMFGISGFWYQWRPTIELDSEVEVSKVTYGTDGVTATAFRDIVNVWDGVIPYAVEAMFYDQSAGTYSTFATGAITVDAMVHESAAAADDKDRLYFNTADPIMGIYIDVGNTPNTTATSVVYGVKAWTGAAFTTVGTITDGTNGLRNSGWITWPRLTTVQPTQFMTTQYYAYWYYFWIGTATASADVVISILTMPYFDIEELGRGQCNCVWKNRPVLSFTLWPNYLYLGAENSACSFNGDDYGILVAGDGRRNKITAMIKFHNELVVFQEERGLEGGTVTLFQGYSPTTWGKLLISAEIGTFSDKTVAYVDGVLTSTKTDEAVKNLIFFLSRFGVCATDGLTISVISDDIQNYFDPTKSECIRRGYEDKMWLKYDHAFNAIRIGLVSGISIQTSTATSTTASKLVDTAGAFTTKKTVSGHPITHKIKIGDTVYNTTDSTSALITSIDSATALSLDTDIMTSAEGYEIYSSTPNLFPVFDLTDKTWGFDVLGQNLLCMVNVEAGSGNVPVVQVGGGCADGLIYQLNTTTNDVDTAIDSYATMELNSNGEYVQLDEMLLRMEAQAAGNTTLTFTKNSISAGTKTLSMMVEVATQTIRRHRFNLNICDQNISVKIQHNTASQNCGLLDVGFRTQLYKER